MSRPILRFKGFKGNFSKKLFEEITTITRLAGYEYSKYWEEDINQEIIALRGYNIGKCKLRLHNLGYISNKLSLQLIRSKLFKGDIVYPCVGSIGNAVVIEENNKFHIQQNIAKITCNDGTSPYFLVQFLISSMGMKEVHKFNATSSQPNVLVGSLRKFTIHLPTLPEQKKIADFLTAIDEKINQLSQKKALLERYKKGVMQKIFKQEIRFRDEEGKAFGAWEEKRLKELVKLFIVPMRDKPKNLTGDIPWCRIEDFDGKYLTKSKSGQGVSYSTVEEMNLKIYPVGTLLVSCSANLGKCAITRKEIITNQTFIGLLPKINSLNVNFFYYVMTRSAHILNRLSSGTTISYLSRREFENFQILCPCIIEQKKIADFLSIIDDRIKQATTQLEQTQQYKKGLLQQLFV